MVIHFKFPQTLILYDLISMTHIIVRRTHPLKYYSIRLLMLLFTAALFAGVFKLGYKQLEKDIINAQGGRKSLLVQQSFLQKKNSELTNKIIRLERQAILDKQSYHLVQLDFTKHKQQIAELKKKLAFYKGLVLPDKTRQTVYLQSLDITSAQKNLYHYQFIIARNIKKITNAKGKVKILIKGKKDNKEVEFSLLSLEVNNKGEKKTKNSFFKYGFKYFHKFDGIIRLPEGVIPQLLSIIIEPKNKKSKIKVDIVWSTIGGVKYVWQ